MTNLEHAVVRLCDAVEALPGPLGPVTRQIVREARELVLAPPPEIEPPADRTARRKP